ncbi:MAG: hypothetical protein ABL952_17150 [Pyrinomonadaceae bacterium]
MSNPHKEIMETLELLFAQAQMRFGSGVKGRWFHDGEGCPGCGKEIKGMKYKGQDTLSLNAFIYREHGVLIGYLLCGKCAKTVIKATSQTPLHDEIEKNLKKAFVKHLGH